jgi:g-D-glutamyl-meso-diaminopimelate peptidase
MSTNIVETNTNYGFSVLEKNLNSLKKAFPFISVSTIGKSILGKNLYVVKLGKGPKEVFYSASIHANEWITSIVLMKFIEDYANAYMSSSSLYRLLYKRYF